MKKLAKVFALVLTAAMSLSMMASAAFTDADKIVNSNAVNVVSTLGIIAGYTDGTFQGEKTVTRAEMAKMIYTLKMGGKDDGAAYYKSLGVNLTDISGHWAEGYIKYCASLGIIAGKGDGKFYPDEGVTGLQAAKMLLIVQGYDANKAGLVGNTWAMKTASLAADSEYFTDYGPALDEACPRDYAALLIYNALDATYVVWSSDVGAYVKDINNKDCVSLGSKYFKMNSYEGILVGCGKYAIEVDGQRVPAGVGKISMAVQKIDDGQKKELKDATAKTFEYSEDVTNLVGQYVKITAAQNGKVYGIFAVNEQNNVIETTMNNVKLVKNESAKLNIEGTNYKVSKKAVENANDNSKVVLEGKTHVKPGVDSKMSDIVKYFSNKGASTSDAAANASKVTFIDYNGDEEFDLVIVNPIKSVKEITNVRANDFSAGGTIKLDEVTVIGELVKGNYVIETEDYVNDRPCYTVVEPITGKASSVRKSYIAKIDDNTYALAGAGTSSLLTYKDGPKDTGFKSGSTYSIVAVNGIVYMYDKTAGTLTDVAVVTSFTNIDSTIKLLRADGTKVSISAGNAEIASYKAEDDKSDIAIGDLVTYEIDDETYKLSKIGDYEDAANKTDNYKVLGGYEEAAQFAASAGVGYDKDSGMVKGTSNKTYDVKNDAVVFIGQNVTVDDNKITAGEFSVITGAKVNDLSSNFGKKGGSVLINSGKAEIVVLLDDTDLPGAASSRTLVYLKEAFYDSSNKIDGKAATELTVVDVNGEESTIYMQGNHANKFVEGDIFAYDRVDDNFVSNKVLFLSEIVALKEGDVNGSFRFANGTSAKASSDLQIMYLDTGNETVMSSGEIPSKTETHYNARYFLNDEGRVLFIAVEASAEDWTVNGDYHANKGATTKDTKDDGTILVKTVENLALAEDLTVAEDEKLYINGTLSIAESKQVTITVKGTLVIGEGKGAAFVNNEIKVGEVSITGAKGAEVTIGGTTYTHNGTAWSTDTAD